MGITVQPQGAVGAEVSGVDLNCLDEATLAELREAHAQYSVLFFRNQQLTPEAHIALAQGWGEINVNRFFTPVENYPQIAEVRKEPDQKFNIGGGWHTDHSYDQIPALGSLLYAKEVPTTGGDTLFAGCGAAFDTLSEGIKDTLRTLRAVHSSRHVFGQSAAMPDDVTGLFANADQANLDRMQLQIEKARELKDFVRGLSSKMLLSFANSATCMNYPEFLGDIIRPGLMLYGVFPNLATRLARKENWDLN